MCKWIYKRAYKFMNEYDIEQQYIYNNKTTIDR